MQEFKSSYQPTSTLQTCSAEKILFSILGVLSFFFFFYFPSIWFNLWDEPIIWRKQPDNRKRVTYFFLSNKKLILLDARHGAWHVAGQSKYLLAGKSGFPVNYWDFWNWKSIKEEFVDQSNQKSQLPVPQHQETCWTGWVVLTNAH